jgi:hypothetical protein
VTLRDEYLRIKGRRNLVTVEQIHDWARDNPSSTWHQRLEWNDQAAGRQFRLWQIRQLIAVYIEPSSNVREIVSLTVDRYNGEGGGYRLLSDVMKSPDLLAVMTADALAELARVRDKHRRIVALAAIWNEIDKAEVAQERAAPKHKRKRADA